MKIITKGYEDGFERQIQRQQQERDSDTEFQPKRPTSNRDEPAQRDTGVTQSDWDKFAQDTNELERSRQAAESKTCLMKRLEEIEKRENERNKRHEQLLTTIETTALNFNQATEKQKIY